MLDEDQVILEAYNHWDRVDSFTGGIAEGSLAELQPYDAMRALQWVEKQYPGDPFWEACNWAELERKFKAYANSKLKDSDDSYEKRLLERSSRSNTQDA